MKKIKITSHWLKKHHACEPQVEQFNRLFPKGVVLTKKLILKHGEQFDLDWLVASIGGASFRYPLYGAKRQAGKSDEVAFVETFLSEPRKVKKGDHVMLTRHFDSVDCYIGEVLEVTKVLSPTMYLLRKDCCYSAAFQASRSSFEIV